MEHCVVHGSTKDSAELSSIGRVGPRGDGIRYSSRAPAGRETKSPVCGVEKNVPRRGKLVINEADVTRLQERIVGTGIAMHEAKPESRLIHSLRNLHQIVRRRTAAEPLAHFGSIFLNLGARSGHRPADRRERFAKCSLVRLDMAGGVDVKAAERRRIGQQRAFRRIEAAGATSAAANTSSWSRSRSAFIRRYQSTKRKSVKPWQFFQPRDQPSAEYHAGWPTEMPRAPAQYPRPHQ